MVPSPNHSALDPMILEIPRVNLSFSFLFGHNYEAHVMHFTRCLSLQMSSLRLGELND